MDNRLIALLLVEEYRKHEHIHHKIWIDPETYSVRTDGEEYLAFLKSIACRSTDRYKGITGYRLAVREIENR